MFPKSLALLLKATLMAGSTLLVSCGTTHESLDYNANAAKTLVKGGKKNVTVSVFQDKRGTDLKYLGSVRPGSGVSLRKIETNIPVSDVVGNTFGYGLHLRNMAATPGKSKWRLGGVIREFSCDQVLRSGASAEITVLLYTPGASEPVFRKSFHGEQTKTSLLLGDTGVLRDLASEVLQDVVDQALDDPELRKFTDK